MELYVGLLRDHVNVYDSTADGDAAPLRSIHGPSTKLDGVTDVVLDSVGNLYVGNAATSTITVYGPTADGDTAPLRVVAGNLTHLAVPGGLAIDSADNLYVLNTGGIPADRTITVYTPDAAGNAAPLRRLTGIQVDDGNLNGIAIDNFDFLYLSENVPPIIRVYAPGANGAVTPVRTIRGGQSGLAVPSDMAFDGANNLYVGNGIDVLIFAEDASGGAAPIRRIAGPSTGIVDDFDLAVDADGHVYVGNFPSDFSDGWVTVYPTEADGDVAPIQTIAGIETGLGIPSGGIAVPKVRAQHKPIPVDPQRFNPWVEVRLPIPGAGTGVSVNLITGKVRIVPRPRVPPKRSQDTDEVVSPALIALLEAAATVAGPESKMFVEEAVELARRQLARQRQTSDKPHKS